MRIYIDESGGFVPESAPSRVCCHAAVIVPERFAAEVLGKFERLRRQWTAEPEIKGSSLTDTQTASVLTLLRGHGITVEICAIDVAHHSAERVKAFQAEQAASFEAGLTPQHSAASRQFVADANDRWLRLPPQLAIQVRVLIGLMEAILRHVPNYYAQRIPPELGRWDWIVDPKDKTPTEFEGVWRQIIGPLLQTTTLQEPSARVEGFDYSSFERFAMDVPEYVQPLLPAKGKRRRATNLRMLFNESVSFPDSRDEPGLQVADIVASAFTKAMNGKLPEDVWLRLGPLLVEKPSGELPVRMVALGGGPTLKVEGHHKRVLVALKTQARPMLVS